MDPSRFTALLLVIIGTVVFVTAAELFTFWVGEAALTRTKANFAAKVSTFKRSLPSLSIRPRRKTA